MKIIKYLIMSIICSILIINNCNAVENKILFKVNNEIITSQDILNELIYLRIINKEFQQIEKEKAFEVSKNSLIREKIKEVEIKRLIKEIKIDDKIMNNLILTYFKEFGIKSSSEFEIFFKNRNLNPNLIRKKISLEFLWNQLIFSKYNKNVKIDKDLIRKNLTKKKKQEEFLISEILFNVNENENLDTKYNLIKNSIENINFSQTALVYSISDSAKKGGNLGWIPETVLTEKIYKKIKNLNIGEYTNPILVPGGFLILKILDVRKIEKKIDLNKEIKKIINEKTNQQLNRFSNIYFNKVQKEVLINEL